MRKGDDYFWFDINVNNLAEFCSHAGQIDFKANKRLNDLAFEQVFWDVKFEVFEWFVNWSVELNIRYWRKFS